MHPVRPQEGRELGDRVPVVMRVDGVVHRIADERAEIMREAVGVDALALDQAGIAITGLTAGLAAIDQQHRAARLLQMQRHRNPDDARPNNDRVRTHST